ncbi:hypothetical protein [Nocardia sp. NPDC050710]|uniref:DUF6630 family protein n=1 Tax=Nocardia sp. NPDC050710 TaxID=3157220 RepID=UPI003410219D
MKSQSEPAVLVALAELLAPGRPQIVAAVRRATEGTSEDSAWDVLYEQLREPDDDGPPLTVGFDWKEDPGNVPEYLRTLSSYPAALTWDWFEPSVAEFVELEWHAGEIMEGLLPEVGEQCLRVGVALMCFPVGDSYEVCFANADAAERITELAAGIGRENDLFVLREGVFD